jgi:FkbM family methyltransferase
MFVTQSAEGDRDLGKFPALSFKQRCTWGAHFFKALTKQHHTAFASRVVALIPTDAVVIDVGAHAGQFTKLFAAMAPQGKVYASEPGSYALSILKRVVALRGLKNVVVTSQGFSDRECVEVLHVPLKKSGSVGFGLSHIGAESTSSGRMTRTEQISLTTIDQFVAQHQLKRVDFIKADIEGWEFNLLAGARETLKQYNPSLLLEVDESMLARAGASPQAIFSAFDGLGYCFFRTDEKQGYRCWQVNGFEGNGDYLFMPQEKASALKVD